MNPNQASANKTYNITTNGTTYIPVPANPKGKLVLIRVVVNTKGGTGHTAAIYDTTEAIGLDVSRKKATLDDVNVIGSVDYGFPVFDGLAVVTGGGTASDLALVFAETP